MPKKYLPLADNVVVKPGEKEEVSKGGIVLPDSAKERPKEGKVIGVGPGRVGDDGKKIPMELKVGDMVVYRSYAGMELKDGDEEFLILRESEVLAKVTE